MSWALGSRIGAVLENRYEVVRALSAGGMGEVYEGRHLTLRRRVAIKFLRPELAQRVDALARFENEAKIAGSLEHENVAAVYDVGRAKDGSPYLVMEFLEGEDCSQLLRREGALEPRRGAGLLLQVCRGLAAAHERGVIHRDLKPGNLFVCRRPDASEVVKVLDFGIAKLRNVQLPGVPATAAALGTPHYMSPEQATGDPRIDQRTDVYALGVILYELLSGQRPFEGDSGLQIIHHILTSEALPLQRLRPGLPPAAYALVSRALARDREQRFATVRELGAALQALRDGSDAEAVSDAVDLAVHPVQTVRCPLTPPRLDQTTHVPVSPDGRFRGSAPRRVPRVVWAFGSALLLTGTALFLYWRGAHVDEGVVSPPSLITQQAELPFPRSFSPPVPMAVHPIAAGDSATGAIPRHTESPNPAERLAPNLESPAAAARRPRVVRPAAIANASARATAIDSPAAQAPVQRAPSPVTAGASEPSTRLKIDREDPYLPAEGR